MKEFWTSVQVVFTAIGGWLGWFLGGCDGLMYALIAFVVVDYITGIMCAIVDRKLSSAIGFKLTWTLSKGRQYKGLERDTDRLKDTETGVAKPGR